MADASGRDLTQFERWYLQAGTPTVSATSTYDAAAKVYRLTLSQSTPPTPGQPEKLPFHIPVEMGLLSEDGALLASETLELTEAEQTFEFGGIDVWERGSNKGSPWHRGASIRRRIRTAAW